MALSLLITFKFTILHGLEYIHYPVDIIHQITIFRTQVISGLSEPTICFPNHNFLIEICPLLNPTNICAHSLRFFANFWFPCLCQLSLNWWSRWRQLGPTPSPGRTMLPHSPAGCPDSGESTHLTWFVPWETEVKKVHLITKLLTKSRIWFLKCFTWLSLVPWEHNYSLNRFTYSTVDGHQYGKYNSPWIHLVIAKIWISIGKQSSEKFPVYVYPGKLWRLLS